MWTGLTVLRGLSMAVICTLPKSAHGCHKRVVQVGGMALCGDDFQLSLYEALPWVLCMHLAVTYIVQNRGHGIVLVAGEAACAQPCPGRVKVTGYAAGCRS